MVIHNIIMITKRWETDGDNSWYYNSHAKTHPSNVFIILYITHKNSNITNKKLNLLTDKFIILQSCNIYKFIFKLLFSMGNINCTFLYEVIEKWICPNLKCFTQKSEPTQNYNNRSNGLHCCCTILDWEIFFHWILMIGVSFMYM